MLQTSANTVKKSGKGCWTCKRRKIGCDQGLPHCQNCIRTNRRCDGYGLKLVWPEDGDGRRPLNSWSHDRVDNLQSHAPTAQEHCHFLTTTNEDLEILRLGKRLQKRRIYGKLRQPEFAPINRPSQSLKYGFEISLNSGEANLLSYYHAYLSGMITTTNDATNGFRTVLLPTALHNQSLSSQSLRQSILALSSTHLHGPDAAIEYKLNAIRLLSRSLDCMEADVAAQFASCMMLCVCEVFGATDESWYMHLRAAKSLASRFDGDMNTNQSIHFYKTWFSYHDVLSDFTYGNPTEIDNRTASVLSEPTDNTTIVGSVGCSMEVLKCISFINKLTKMIEQSCERTLPPRFSYYPELLLSQLSTLVQIPIAMRESNSSQGQLDMDRIIRTAEFYRLAALIYLHRSLLGTPTNSAPMQGLVDDSLQILQDIGVCTSPWPLFITACEVLSDCQRIQILAALDSMQQRRRIGNYEMIREIIEAVWKQTDLIENPRQSTNRLQWKSIVDLRPSFI